MYILVLNYYKSPESKYPDEKFELDYLKGRADDFAKLYNLHGEVFAGELDYVRETNIDEVKKWLNEGIIRLAFPSRDLEKFNDVVMTATSPILKIRASYWQTGYD